MGVMLSAAGSLQWHRDTIAPELSFDQLVNEAGDVSPGSEGLLFLPYLTGERTPYPDPLARGAWVGLTVRHQRAHLTRAVLEGVAFGLKDSFRLIQGSWIRCHRAGAEYLVGARRASSGSRILADVLGVELVTVNTTEGAAFGAALLAGVGSGLYRGCLPGRGKHDSTHRQYLALICSRARIKNSIPATRISTRL